MSNSKPNSTLLGVGFVTLGLLILSLQDIAVKWLGNRYPALEIVLLRSIWALPCTLLLFRLEGRRGLPKTHLHNLEYARGACLFFSFLAYMMGIAALPLADVAAIRNAGPLLVTLLSVLMLNEQVGLRHWLALLMGFCGVLLIVRPGGSSFNLGSLFVVLALLLYALSVILTGKLRGSDSGATMAYFSALVYLAASFVFAPLSFAIGEVQSAQASIAFLFHTWSVPSLLEWAIMSGMGITWATGMYFLARAYSVARASTVAPFEYVSLPINVMWGFVIWHEVPLATTWLGAALTIFSGLLILYWEQQKPKLSAKPA